MTLDPKKLRSDAKRLQGARPPTTAGMGATAAIRDALPVIYALRKEGVKWSAIAGALAEQGIVQGKDAVPLTTARLTALVAQIESRERLKASTTVRVRPDTSAETQGDQPRLTTPTGVDPRNGSTSETADSEQDLRRAAYEKLQSILKKE